MFNAGGLSVQGDFYVNNGVMLKGINLIAAKIGGDLSARNARVEGKLNADRLKVGGTLFLDGEASFQDVGLIDAEIGHVAAEDSEFEGMFNAGGLSVQGDFYVRNGVMLKGINLIAAKIGGDLSARNARVEGKLNADRLKVGGTLFLDGEASFRDVGLAAARIGGDLSANGSSFEGKLDAQGISVGGGLHLGDGSTCKTVSLIAAKVGRDFNANNSRFEGNISADRLNVGGAFLLGNAEILGNVGLHAATTGSNLMVIGSRFEGAINAGRLAVGGHLDLRGTEMRGDVDLAHVRIGGSVNVSKSKFSKKLDLTAGKVEGVLNLGQGKGNCPLWYDLAHYNFSRASVYLTNASVDALQADNCSWDRLSKRLELTGLEYQRFVPSRGDANQGESRMNSMADQSAPWLLAWLKKQKNVYARQPYDQLAKILRRYGHDSKADKIMIAANNLRFEHPESRWYNKVVLWLEWATIGYGYHTWLLLIWFLGLTTISTVVGFFGIFRAGKTEDGCKTCKGILRRISHSLWYSIDRLVPFVELSEQHKEVHPHGLTRLYFFILPLIGLMLVSFLIASITGFVK